VRITAGKEWPGDGLPASPTYRAGLLILVASGYRWTISEGFHIFLRGSIQAGMSSGFTDLLGEELVEASEWNPIGWQTGAQ
jgi:hypothetical protein